ncbi:MAG: serine/threonine protein kinase [Deltaproteobacteria bacterium]|nr:serine/threonine protein kinase [Deltaproteobacteria bacterium]
MAEKKTMFGYRADMIFASAAKPGAGAAPAEAAEPPAPAAATPPAATAAEPPVPAAVAPPAAAVAPPPAAAAPAQSTLFADRYAPEGAPHTLPVGTLQVARDTQSNELVDLLIVAPDHFASPLDTERARRELRQLQKVESPHLVRVVDHGKSGNQIYMAMEHIDGATLEQRVAQGPLTLPEAQKVIRALGIGLSDAQKAGVIHRDVAPHNVVFAEDDTIKIRGFGVAPLIKRNVMGTPEYLSPEQAAGRPVDQRSSIYSIGALFFYMITGEPPFSGSAEEILEQHQRAEPPSPADRRPDLHLPPRAAQLITKALAKSSSRRHLTLRQFLRDLDSLSESAPMVQQPVAPAIHTFETPLHGVTSLSGGDRPPSSEFPAIKAAQQMAAASVLAETLPDKATPDAPQQAEDGPSAVGAGGGGAVSGEMSGGARVSMRQKDAQPSKVADEPVVTPPSGQEAQGAKGGKGGFRETMWFFKGEIESELAQQGETSEAPAPEDAHELAAKYRDDGSLDEDEAKRLSLRTGKTQMMQAAKIPSGQLPGEKMSADDFIGEFNKGRKLGLWISLGVLGLAGVGAALFFLLR